MRELRHKFVSEEIPKQITNALNELRRAKFENDMWIMSKKKSVREDGLDDEDKENHAIATPQKVSKECKDQCDDVILNSVKDAAISENCLKTAEATANEISAEVTTVEPEKAA
ncbi:unnamed protein product [Caenorhabditis auriculariae]|uniref:Uncharacterized protein n=1 Tax=Caenorhabditis auriculariae TaxID=2777116 RepID=A0A8S1HLR5_9PELO|nr:unnamed protein product [Caenorhabditis auriculariae]